MQEKTFAAHQVTAQLAAIKQNNEAVLQALYVENYPKVEAYVLNNSGTKDEAKDVYQEAFVALWRNIQLDKFTPTNNASLGGYLYQIAKNKWLDHLRSVHHKKVGPLDGTENGILIEELPNDQQAYLLAVRKNFARLGNTCREVLQRFYFGKESLRSIAQAFQWTEATAKNNKYRCLQQLREFIKTQ